MELSFINERTLEYIIVPKFYNLLKEKYSNVIPIYYWATREGNNTAFEMLKNKTFKIVALYSRRPKLDNITTDTIFVKLNDILFEKSAILNEIGIPVFAATSGITSFDNFDYKSPSFYFHIAPNKRESIIKIDLKDISKCQSLISEQFILDKIKKAKTLSWDVFRAHLRSNNLTTRFSFYSGVYKPVYFLIEV